MSYVSHVADEAQEKAGTAHLAAPQEGHRWGSGRTEIQRVMLCDAAGHERKVFVTGEPMEIRLDYTIHPGAADPVFGLAIHHQNGVHVCGPNTQFDGLSISNTPGNGQIVYRVPRLPLLEGGYLLSVAAVDGGDSEVYDYHDRVYSFRVSPGHERERYGVVTLGGAWSQKSQAQHEVVTTMEAAAG
jgi:lipopolysaccharide transport system ATP-binding protein